MFDNEQFSLIKGKHGHYASWAVWAREGDKPKANIGDLAVFDLGNNPGLLKQLKPNVILVGLNISRRIETPLANFHDARPQAMDFNIRFAFKGTSLWGSYMTDIIKGFEQKVSGKMMAYLKANPRFERQNADRFRLEAGSLGIENPTVVAFGCDAHKILCRNFMGEYRILLLPHYSNYGSKEKYREEVLAILKESRL